MGVKDLRQERSWSQDYLAELSGLSLRTVQRIESSGKATRDSTSALAEAFKIDRSALEIELALSKSSNGWKRRPAWVRALFIGSGVVQMDSRQHVLIERSAVSAGILFVIVAVFGANGTLVSESARFPLLLSGSLMFLAAYLMSLIVRIGDRHSVWPWVEPQEDNG